MNKPPAEHEYMLGDESDRSLNGSGVQKPPSKEWVPDWLRKVRLFALAAYCIIFAIVLEALDITIRRHHGLAADDKHSTSINAARYVPTVGIVLLGFACKAVASDAKRVTPWASMSRKWSKSSHSVALDYINSIEVFSIFSSARRGHWAVFVGLLVCFICGALVAVANALTYINLFASSSEPGTFNKATTFDFDGTLENTGNESLSIAYTYEGQQPYAAVYAELLPNGRSAAWTKDSYVFESFTNTSQLAENTTIEAPTKAFHTGWTCHPLNLEQKDKYDYGIYFRADVSKQPELNCSQDVQMKWQNGFDVNKKTLGFLNVTACNDDGSDLRLVSILGERVNATVVRPKNDTDTFNTTVVGVLCSPLPTLQDATVRVNASTGEVIQYQLGSSAPSPADIKTSMNALYIYLNNPVDGRTQEAFAHNYLGWTYNTEPQANLTYVTMAASYFVEQYYIDPFSSLLTNDQAALEIGSYLGQPQKLKAAVEQQANRIMAQMVNSLARTNLTGSVDGEVWTAGPKMFLRQAALRALQGLLVFVAIISILQSTLLRPKTILREDPGSIAAKAVVLASSAKSVEKTFAREAVSSESSMDHVLATKAWRLQAGANGGIMLEATKPDQHQALHPVPSHAPGTNNHEGFHPVALRVWAKLGVIAATLLVMAALALLMALSRARDGICRDTPSVSDAFAFVPTVVLLILGYACSGIDGAVRMMAPYKSLWKGSSGRKQPLLFNFRDYPSIMAPIRAIRNGLGLAVAVSSAVILIIPAIKIVTAGLYTVTLVQTTYNIQPIVDTSLVDHLEDTFSLSPDTSSETYSYLSNYGVDLTMDLNANVQTASQFTEWTMNPDFNIPVRSGILENVVFSNLTDVGNFSVEGVDLSAGEITVNVPALAVDVTCKYVETVPAAYRQNCSDGQPYFTFYAACGTAYCNSTLNATESSSIIALNIDASSGARCRNASNRFIGSTFVRYDMGYRIALGDFGSINTNITNTTAFSNHTQLVTADMFNSTGLPSFYTAVCYSNLTRVTVDTTFSRKSTTLTATSLNSTNSSTTTAWNPIRFDRGSLRTESVVGDTPYWLAPLAKTKAWDHYDQYDQSSDTPGLLDSEDLWPTRGSSTSFFELLAAYATYNLNNLTALLNPDDFTAAAEAVYTSYTTNMLTELRPWALNASTAASSSSSKQRRAAVGTSLPNGRLAVPESRIKQDLPSTIALEACLAVMLACFVWVAIRFPNEAVLPKSPGSIAAAASLLAGSALVGDLRRKGVSGVGDVQAEGWKGAALGWWGVRREEKEGDGSEGEEGGGGVLEGRDRRWGIDVGEGVVRGSWKGSEGRAVEGA
ncbi:hypothetical protein DBV05_g4813 [Lasiodiplodia theobromae]|uniref:Uncharacterized protein n=1 Tax=Lasiodiplodia theobromae TaxID=45133 RepID=A0A5N5DF51_9PEZI|nr:hypothetical protein DBV05_g4813 [Lasiodiplodia theobromae]